MKQARLIVLSLLTTGCMDSYVLPENNADNLPGDTAENESSNTEEKEDFQKIDTGTGGDADTDVDTDADADADTDADTYDTSEQETSDTETSGLECNADLASGEGDWRDVCPVEVIRGEGQQCITPCGVELVVNEDHLGMEWSALFLNPNTGEGRLTNDPSLELEGWILVVMLTYDSSGYDMWFRAYSEPIDIENDHYDQAWKMLPFDPARVQINELSSDTPVNAVVSFGDHEVYVHAVYIPKCHDTGDGVCENGSDCPPINDGVTYPETAACQACYDQYAACSEENCPIECPSTGNGCKICEVNAGCNTEFMACSGLDYLPPGTINLPNWG